MAHTPGLYEMAVTRSLLPIGWPALRPANDWLPLGMLLCVQWSNEKEAQAESIFPFFVVVVVAFFLAPSIFTLRLLSEKINRQSPLLSVCHKTILSLSLWLHPL